MSTRAAITSPTVCDAAVSTDAAAKPTNPDTNTRRRPNRSASPLPTSNSPASETRNASSTHCNSPIPASRSLDMSGSATFTIVMSIALMNIATQMTPRPHHRLSSTASRAGGADAKWMKCGTSMAAYAAVARSRAHATACVNSAAWLSRSSLGSIPMFTRMRSATPQRPAVRRRGPRTKLMSRAARSRRSRAAARSTGCCWITAEAVMSVWLPLRTGQDSPRRQDGSSSIKDRSQRSWQPGVELAIAAVTVIRVGVCTGPDGTDWRPTASVPE